MGCCYLTLTSVVFECMKRQPPIIQLGNLTLTSVVFELYWVKIIAIII